MDKVIEKTPDERGMIIEGAWQSIGIVFTIAISHIAISFRALLRNTGDELRLAAIDDDVTWQSIRIISTILISYIASSF
ncbi:hypothetical protein Y032_0554g3363 [Ancylostoma ceylanicum]|uniref:Uncharacterized protein n=1 Tax=Ancylostoma ceylanicum TaxID=53326 RepID=A0A016WPS5_9BILA|nr:hypothetical protein Y032_0554g3363 [Ancylostoma ceylanicum]